MFNIVRFAGGRTKFNQVSMYRKQIVAGCSTSVFADLNWKLNSSSWTCQKCKLIWTRTIIVYYPRRYPSPFVSFDNARPASFFSTAIFLATNKSSTTSRYLDKSPTSILDNDHVKYSKINSENKRHKGLNGCAHPSSDVAMERDDGDRYPPEFFPYRDYRYFFTHRFFRCRTYLEISFSYFKT